MLLIILVAVLQDPTPIVLDAGALTCEIHISRTAHLFHVVDQLSEWSEYCHRQYGRYFNSAGGGGLSEADRALLAEHAALRKRRGWGQGLEQAFYVPSNLETALAAAIKGGHLTEEDAAVERRVFEHFKDRVDKLIADHREVLDDVANRLARENKRLAADAGKVSKLFGGAKVSVPVYLLANPHDEDGGGGFNGGKVVVEIPRKRDSYSTLVHEIFHAFLHLRRDAIEAAAKGVPGLDFATLNEGIAHALAPGIIHSEKKGHDPLESTVKGYQARNLKLDDYYYRVWRFGLELRPLMKEALESGDGSIEKLIPIAAAQWPVLVEKEKKRKD